MKVKSLTGEILEEPLWTIHDDKFCKGCETYLFHSFLVRMNDPSTFPMDVDWAHCMEGPEVFINCKKRKEAKERIR